MEKNCNILSALDSLKRLPSPSQVMVTYSWINHEGKEVTQTHSASELYEDWYGECEYCPENDAPLTSLKIGQVDIPKNGTDGTELVFEDLMQAIQKGWKWKAVKK